MLYKRDYNLLTEDEQKKLTRAEEYLNKNRDKHGIVSGVTLSKYHQIKPEAAYYFESLFPNNYLSLTSLEDKKGLKQIEVKFESLLNSDVTERKILNFINNNEYYNLIASIFYDFRFGHHDAYLFKEFELTSTYKADYLLVGKNSDGYHFVFIELENPTSSITTKNGEFGSTIRKGLKQVADWDKWMEENFTSLSIIFDKYKSKYTDLPKEFRKLNKSRLNYAVVCGRRSDFTEYTYDEKRRLQQSKNIHLMHYDNLIDNFKNLQLSSNY